MPDLVSSSRYICNPNFKTMFFLWLFSPPTYHFASLCLILRHSFVQVVVSTNFSLFLASHYLPRCLRHAHHAADILTVEKDNLLAAPAVLPFGASSPAFSLRTPPFAYFQFIITYLLRSPSWVWSDLSEPGGRAHALGCVGAALAAGVESAGGIQLGAWAISRGLQGGWLCKRIWMILIGLLCFFCWIYIYGCSVYLVKENDYDLATDWMEFVLYLFSNNSRWMNALMDDAAGISTACIFTSFRSSVARIGHHAMEATALQSGLMM